MSKQRSPKPKEATINSEESSTRVVCEATPAEALPFAEFSEQDINLQRWDNIEDKLASTEFKSFEDPHEVHLPAGFTANQWKRCSDIFPNANFVIPSAVSTYPDLVSPNQHLTVVGGFYKNFISSIEFLLYVGCNRPSPQEHEHNGFFAKGQIPWRPWNHIYSNCKITKGEHFPMYNPAGKYVVRLFWMGTWRKIYVDDFVPVDLINNILLPTLTVPKLKAEQSLDDLRAGAKTIKAKETSLPKRITIEIWPIILCKALLKLASLRSPSTDFDIINCLTGWVPQRVKTKEIPDGYLWDIFMAYVKRFEWDNGAEGNAKKTENPKPKSKVEVDTPSEASKATFPLGMKAMPDGDCFVALSCINANNLAGDDNENAASKFVFLSEIRDIPLTKPLPSPELEFWKMFRYEKWAVEKGLISPDIKKLNIKSLRIVDPFNKIIEIPNKRSILIDNVSSHDSDFIDKKSEKSLKTSKKSSKPTTKVALLGPDPSQWIDFADIQKFITHIIVYFQPRLFRSKTKISDLFFAFKSPDFSHVTLPYLLQQTKNEPLYLFTDSTDDKILLINLAQMGDVTMLKKIHKEEKPSSDIIDTETLDICEEILLKKTFVKEASSSEFAVQQEEPLNFCSYNKSISVVLEDYNWESNSVGRFINSINTLGSESVIMELKPGRHSLKIWLTSHCPYVLQIFSDTPLTIGSLEDYLSACSKESQLLTNLCHELSSCFDKLEQSFGTPDHSQCLKNFYCCYKPQQPLTKKELAVTHKIFFEEFCKTASKSSLAQDAVKAVKLLFLQLKTFNYINLDEEEPHLCPEKFELYAQVEYAKKMQKAAVTIQAFFKQIYVRAMLRKFNENHKYYSAISGNLKKIYQEFFSSDTCLTYCPNLIRKIFERPEIIPFRNKFEIFQDLKSVLDLKIFDGILVTQDSAWIPICRYEFHINFNEPILLKIAFFSNLKTQAIRVFNNDNTNEVKQLFNNVLVEKYSLNKTGYTAVAYGFLPDGIHVNKVNWQLVFATRKMYQEDLILIPSIPLTTLSLRDQYIPNFKNIICRYNIKVGTDAYLTASLTTSHSGVKICLRLLDKNEKLIRQICGLRNVVFPLVELRFLEPQPDECVGELKKKVITSHITMNSSNIFSADADTGKGLKRHKKGRSSDGSDDINATTPDSHRKNHLTKTGSKLSLSARSNKNSSKAAQNTIRDFAHTVYILEAKVVNDSWPLTADEWTRVQKAKEKNYINFVASRPQKKPKKSSLTIEEPHWTLDLLYAENSVLEFKQDVSANEQRKSVKMEWFEDPERYRRGTELRDAHLQDHLKLRSVPSIDTSFRSNDRKDFALQVIKDEPLDKYMTKPLEKVDLDFCKTKNEDDYVIDEANRERQFKEYQIEEQAMQDDIEGMLQEQMENFQVLSKWFKNIRNDSERALIMNRNLLREKFTEVSRKNGKDDKRGKEKKKK